MKVNVTWSKQVWVISLIVLTLILITELGLIYSIIDKGFNYIGMISAIVILTAILYVISIAPLSLSLNENDITINKIIGKKVIKIKDISEVFPYSVKGYNIRIFGSGGFFGYTGIFKEKHLGKYNSYVGDYSQSFILKLKSGRLYMISSEDRELVIQFIESILRQEK